MFVAQDYKMMNRKVVLAMFNKKIILGILVVAIVCCAIGRVRAEMPNSEKVTVTGMGTNVAEARRDAWEKALIEVIGVYVETTKRVVDAKLQEEILTFSNGYIAESREISREEDGDSVTIEMEVVVKCDDLEASLKTGTVKMIPITQVPLDQRRDQAKKLLKNCLKFYPSNVVEVVVQGKKATARVGASGETVALSIADLVSSENDELFLNFDLVLTVNEKKYRAFVKQLLPLLEVVENKSSSLQSLERASYTGVSREGGGFQISAFDIFKFDKETMKRRLTSNEGDNTVRIAVCTNNNNSASQTRWQTFLVESAVCEYFKTRGVVKLEFLDERENVVIEKNIPIRMLGSGVFIGHEDSGRFTRTVWHYAPLTSIGKLTLTNNDVHNFIGLEYHKINCFEEGNVFLSGNYYLRNPRGVLPLVTISPFSTALGNCSYSTYLDEDADVYLPFYYQKTRRYLINDAVFEDEVEQIASVRVTVVTE